LGDVPQSFDDFFRKIIGILGGKFAWNRGQKRSHEQPEKMRWMIQVIRSQCERLPARTPGVVLIGLSGWWFQPTPLKNIKVSWDDYSQYMESHKIPWFQTTNQY